MTLEEAWVKNQQWIDEAIEHIARRDERTVDKNLILAENMNKSRIERIKG